MFFFLDHFIDFVVFREIEKISIEQSRVAAKEFRKKLLIKIVRCCRQAHKNVCDGLVRIEARYDCLSFNLRKSEKNHSWTFVGCQMISRSRRFVLHLKGI